MTDISFEEDTRCNEYKLEREWARQSELTMKWTRKHALAVSRTNRAREFLRVTKAETKRETDKERADVYFDIRKHPEDYNLSKDASETAINHAINQDREFYEFCNRQERKVKDANDDLIVAIEEELIYEGAVKAMMAKRRAIENLQILFGLGYYGEPKGKKVERGEQSGREIEEQVRRGRDVDR